MTAVVVAGGVAALVLAVKPRRVDMAPYLTGEDAAPAVDRRPRRLPGAVVAGAAIGALAGLAGGGSVLSLALLGGAAGGIVARAVRSTSRQRRERRLVQELPTVADTLSLHVLAGASVTSALRALAASCRGVAVDEIVAALTDPDGLELGLRRASRDSVSPEGARLYDLLGHAHRTGGRLADSLADLAVDYRSSLTADLTAEGGRRALAAYGPILAFMIPVTLLFLMYPTLAGLSALSVTP